MAFFTEQNEKNKQNKSSMRDLSQFYQNEMTAFSTENTVANALHPRNRKSERTPPGAARGVLQMSRECPENVPNLLVICGALGRAAPFSYLGHTTLAKVQNS